MDRGTAVTLSILTVMLLITVMYCNYLEKTKTSEYIKNGYCQVLLPTASIAWQKCK